VRVVERPKFHLNLKKLLRNVGSQDSTQMPSEEEKPVIRHPIRIVPTEIKKGGKNV